MNREHPDLWQNKCFDTKKAQRYFKERGVKFQAIDLLKYGISVESSPA